MNPSRFTSSDVVRPTLNELCVLAVNGKNGHREFEDLRMVLREAPVTLAEGLGEDLGFEHLVYFVDASTSLATTPFSQQYRVGQGPDYSVEVQIDTQSNMPRKSVDAAGELGWNVSDYQGEPFIGSDQLHFFQDSGVDNLEVCEMSESGITVVYYRKPEGREEKSYLLAFTLFDDRGFRFPVVGGMRT
jgi:hypothetical protein